MWEMYLYNFLTGSIPPWIAWLCFIVWGGTAAQIIWYFFTQPYYPPKK